MTQLRYGTNAKSPVAIKVLKLRSEQIRAVTIDEQPTEFQTETMGNDTFIVFNAPSGQHQIDIIKGSAAAADTDTALVSNTDPEPTPSQPRLNPVVQNSVLPPQSSSNEAPQTSVELSPDHQQDVVIIARNNRADLLIFIQLGSVILVLLTCLALVALVMFRRLGKFKSGSTVNRNGVSTWQPHTDSRSRTVDPAISAPLPQTPTQTPTRHHR